MSWEALTVRSKISFFNKAVALNLLKRFWPLWTAYFAAMIFVFPVNLLSKLRFNLRGSLLEIYGVNRQVLQTCRLEFPVTFVFAVLIAMAVFSYLYDGRRCGLANSLPLRRETMYCTAFITGLVPMLIADLLVWAAAWIILAGTPNVITGYMLIRLGTSLMCSTAFFGLAAFCAALTGNLLVLPVLYGVINIAAVLLERAVEALLCAARTPDVRFTADTETAAFHPGRCAAVWSGDTRLGTLGQIHPDVCAAYGLDGATYCAEIDVVLLHDLEGAEPVYTPLPRFPAITRDIAVVCDASVPVGELTECIRKAEKNVLRGVKLFDVYTGVGIPEGKKSVAFSLELRADDRTLTDEDSTGVVDRVLKALKEEKDVTLR